jgi:putative PIN family toxin of toxin-antitoxin system
MNTDMDGNPVKVTLDTNIVISALGFGGQPREILQLVLDNKIKAITSSILLAEFEDVITKKFPALSSNFERINKLIRKKFKIVKPKRSIHIVADEDDNRVLEAAVEGRCSHIVTGDKELLDLGVYKEIKIVTADQFLNKKNPPPDGGGQKRL